MSARPIPESPTTPLSYALAYAALGWPVLPLRHIRDGACSCGDPECKPRNYGKHPLTKNGFHDATTDAAQIRKWWLANPHANIGVVTGRVSRLVAIDIDAGPGKFGDETLAALLQQHGPLPDTVEALTGSGGRHLLFQYPEAVEEIASRSNVLGPSIDVRADNGYIVVEPSSHRSGTAYVWESSSSPLDGEQPAPLPAWMIGPLLSAVTPAPADPDGLALHPERVKEIRSALHVIESDERDVWLRVGMALHASGAGMQAYGLWCEWSEQSDKYDSADQWRTWKSFKARPTGVHLESLFALANDYGWVAPPTPGLVLPSVREFVASLTRPRAAAARFEQEPIPLDLLQPPGVLGAIAQYGLDSAVRPVPVFAVQAAFALGSVVCARRYRTNQRNYSALYLLNVAKSGTGKEEAKTTIERILSATGFRKLLGGSSYSSGGAVYSALLRKPQHLAVVDEFGKYMEVAAASKDSHRGQALTMLMEAFGRAHGELATPEFSTLSLTPTASKSFEPRVVERPSISLLALTTPSSFYATLRSTSVLDGFLNRFVIAEHQGPREAMREWQDIAVPNAITNWVQQILLQRGNLDDLARATEIPDPLVVPFTESALRLSHSFERDMITLADAVESAGLGDMPIRTREIGMRMALIAALADTPDTPVITDEVLHWCFRYVRFFLEQTLMSLRTRMADSEVERDINTVRAALLEAGARGLSEKEIHLSKRLISLRKRDRLDAIDHLLKAEQAEWQTLRNGGRGRPRIALVAVSPDDRHADDEDHSGEFSDDPDITAEAPC